MKETKEKITIGDAGKIQIPQEILKEIGFKKGDPVEFDVDEFHFDDPADDYPVIVIKKAQNNSKSEQIINNNKEIERAELMENLTFMDGILLTWDIFDRILKKRLKDENGEPEKDDNGYTYLGIINDDINDLLSDQVLEHGYFKNRGNQLINQFGIKI